MRSVRAPWFACLSSLALSALVGPAWAQEALGAHAPGEPAAAASSAPAAAPAGKKQVLLFGSSSMNDYFGGMMENALGKRGLTVTRKGVPAAGFSRPDYRDVGEALAKIKLEQTAAVVVYLGMNDAQAFFVRPAEREDPKRARIQFDQEEAWSAAYEARAKAFFQSTCDRGVKKVAVLMPVDVVSPKMQKRLDRIRALQRSAAAATSCAVAVETGGDTGKFHSAKEPLRVADGVHMSAAGSKVVWERVKDQLLSMVE